MVLIFDFIGYILWVGDDRGVIFLFIIDIVIGKLIKIRRYVLLI